MGKGLKQSEKLKRERQRKSEDKEINNWKRER